MAFTEDQLDIARQVKRLVKYWQSEDRATNDEKIDGVAFSILVLLDGGNCDGSLPTIEALTSGVLHEAYSALENEQ